MARDMGLKPVVTVEAFPTDGSVRSIGWGMVEWIEEWLIQPDGEHAGEPFRLTPEQINFVLWWYAVDASGSFTYRRALLRRSKGWGKSPFVAALALGELCGPCRVGGFSPHGEPFGRPHPKPWIVIAGVSETQAENTLASVRDLAKNDRLTGEFGLDVGITRVFAGNGGKIVPITASSSTQEGARPSFAIADETHHWTTSNGGQKLARVIRRNLAKASDGGARLLETTNAHEPGAGSVAEDTYLAWRAQVEKRTVKSLDVLYDSREAPASVDLADQAQLRAGLRAAYGDASWMDLDRLIAEIYDPTTPPEESRRFYLNQIVAASDGWVAPDELHSNFREDLQALEPGEQIVLGFDGSLTNDSTALVATRLRDGAAFLLAVWEKPEGPRGDGWQVPKPAVRDFVDHVFTHFDVKAFLCDVAHWETDVDAWRDEYGERLVVKASTRHTVGYDMRTNLGDTTRAVEALHRAIVDGEAPYGPHRLLLDDSVDAAAVFERHVLNARRRLNRYGVSFGKETKESPKKVDVVAAWVLSRIAFTRFKALAAEGGSTRGSAKRPGRGYGF